LEKVLLEYEQCQCSKMKKKVTITSIVIKESNETAAPCSCAKQAFDCNEKQSCGVLTVLGKKRLINWAGCTQPTLSSESEPAE